MTLASVPSDETLLRFASGTLDAGVALVLRAHLETSAESRSRLASFEALGGVMLVGERAEPMMEGSLERVLAAIARTEPETMRPLPEARDFMPAALATCEIGPWRWLAPGTRLAKVRGPHQSESRVMLMRFAAGARMLEHSHDGVETTLVLRGSFSDAGTRYVAGAFIEADESVEHTPVVDPDGECICLVAMQGHIKAPFPMGFIARHLMGL